MPQKLKVAEFGFQYERRTVESMHIKINEIKNGVKTLFGKTANENFVSLDLESEI